jgi:hypothetical protein
MCFIPNGFRDRVIWMYSCKIIDKEILRTVYNTRIYCSGDKFVSLLSIFENSTVNISAFCNSCENMACCSAEFILTFLYASSSIHYAIEQFVPSIHYP